MLSNPAPEEARASSRRTRPKRRQLFCPVHPEQLLVGTGRKYFLHLLTPEQLKARGMTDKKAKLVIQAYPVLVLSNEWLENLYCACCSQARWCHVIKHDRSRHSLRWAPRELWEQVAHVDAAAGQPGVGEFSLRQARGGRGGRRPDQRPYFEAL